MLPELERIVSTYVLPSRCMLELQLSFALVSHFCLHCTQRGQCYLSMVKNDNFRKLVTILFDYADVTSFDTH